MENAIKPSKRALANLELESPADLEDKISHLPSYDPETCPDGLIDLSGATNMLVSDLMGEHMRKFVQDYPVENALLYGQVNGPKELSVAVAQFINRRFAPATAVQAEDILTTNGVTALIDMMSFNFCEPGEAVMVLTPTYLMFPHDLCARTGVQMIPVSTESIPDQYSSKYAARVVDKLEQAYLTSQSCGVNVRALLICNPCNPTGRSYSNASLLEMARFCGRHKMHLLSDEIYAMSNFEPLEPELDMFSSVLSIEDSPHDGVFKENIHCLYGASKDFAAGGIRLGFLITRNELLWKTCRRLALFTWVSSLSTAFFTHFLSDAEAVDEYLALYQSRLRTSYVAASESFRKHGIPFQPANSGMFVFVGLTEWLKYFDAPDVKGQEVQLYRYLAFQAGVHLNMGQMSLSPIPGCFRFVHAAGYTKTVALAIARIGEALSKLEARGSVLDQRPASISSTSAIDSVDDEKRKEPAAEPKLDLRGSIVRLLSCTTHGV
ncbi:1-aminocyclopropane-1-carboxylate synthase [Trichoderma guizhouense]|uniref:1-aminocyclopropane-1-carboxylate synthase n=1 Tax=Trichoderma guizhouense TaxID=1491466 RepID=A0A1T3CK27_9HYPO|nr:1-aminocyclopropane-1-carboxylate synthase [Trichoderma guizhouense]